MIEAMLAILVTEVHEGRRSDNGYKKEAWSEVVKAVQDVGGPAALHSDVCKSKYESLKKDFRVYCALIGQSGFSVDDEGVVTGPPEALDAYFEAHKEARKFKSRGLKYLEQLRVLFDGVLATGQDSMSASDLINSIERDHTETPASPSESRSMSLPIQTPRKRAFSNSTASSVRSAKRLTTSNRIGGEVKALTTQIKAFVEVMDKDVQVDALELFMERFEPINDLLKLAFVEVFKDEYAAKSFTTLTPKIRLKWVQRELLMRRTDLIGGLINAAEFDAAVDEVDWDSDGVVRLKSSL